MLISRVSSLLYCFSQCSEESAEFYRDLYSEVSKGLLYVSSDSVLKDFIDGGYRPVKFIHYIRTDLGNLILQDEQGKSFFENKPKEFSGFTVYPNILYDLSLYIGGEIMFNIFNSLETRDEFFQEFALHSTCFPVGAIPDKDCFYIVSNIIVSKSYVESSNLLEFNGFSFLPISECQLSRSLHKQPLIQKFLSTYAITGE